MAAANSSSSCILDAMDKLWFCQNIVFVESHIISLQSTLIRPKRISSSSADENTNRQAMLNIVRGQPLFQLQPSPMSKIRSYPSSPSMNKREPRLKSYRSSSALEKYELKGFMDMGFTFPRDKPNAYMMSMIPGLLRVGENEREQEDERQVKRPYLSEAWFVRSTDSLLRSLRLLGRAPDGAGRKKHLRFWAKSVGMLVHEQS